MAPSTNNYYDLKLKCCTNNVCMYAMSAIVCCGHPHPPLPVEQNIIRAEMDRLPVVLLLQPSSSSLKYCQSNP